MSFTPHIPLEELPPGLSDPHEPINDIIFRLSTIGFGPVKSATTATPPGSPAHGDLYALPASPSGAWAGQGLKLAVWNAPQAGWIFVSPWGAFTRRVVDTQQFMFWTGSGWGYWTATGIGSVQADTTPTLGGDLNGNQKAVGGVRAKPAPLWTGTNKTWDKSEAQIVHSDNTLSRTLTLPNDALPGAHFLLFRNGSQEARVAPAGGAQLYSDKHGGPLVAIKTGGLRAFVPILVESNASGSNAVYVAGGAHTPST